jgi:hypothetical protein
LKNNIETLSFGSTDGIVSQWPNQKENGVVSKNKCGFPGESEPPKPYKIWDVSWLYSLDEPEFVEMERCLTYKCLLALRRCALVGEEVNSFIWNSNAYKFDPHAEIPSICMDHWAVPVVPDGDNYFFIASDLSFGILSLCKKMSICVFGEKLLETLCSERPKVLRDVLAFSDR